ncbi:MAG TPA: hypothetical protein VGF30_08680 [Bacteroidia bacterium]
MRALVSILLLAVILFQTTAKLSILIQFKINQDYIAKNLCINRAKPKSCCEGSCHLNKQLEEEEKQENVPSAPNLKGKFELMPCTVMVEQKWSFDKNIIEPSFIYILKEYTTESRAVFHPPDFPLV